MTGFDRNSYTVSSVTSTHKSVYNLRTVELVSMLELTFALHAWSLMNSQTILTYGIDQVDILKPSAGITALSAGLFTLMPVIYPYRMP